MSMGELAAALRIDPPNATVLVDESEALGVARRRPHPTDRRARIVEATRKGKASARRADTILNGPQTRASSPAIWPGGVREHAAEPASSATSLVA